MNTTDDFVVNKEYLRKYIERISGMSYPEYLTWIKEMIQKYNLGRDYTITPSQISITKGIMYVRNGQCSVAVYDIVNKRPAWNLNEYNWEKELAQKYYEHNAKLFNFAIV